MRHEGPFAPQERHEIDMATGWLMIKKTLEIQGINLVIIETLEKLGN